MVGGRETWREREGAREEEERRDSKGGRAEFRRKRDQIVVESGQIVVDTYVKYEETFANRI